jgi:RNA polymerase sigma factor (sigma-70 family)
VHRFQDLAFACACARLRDAALAEDAAQDAFLTAWERLGQLREPDAFGGWIQRLVLTQCHRRLRGIRLRLVPEDEACDTAEPRDVVVDVEAADEASLVRRVLSSLAPADRLVLILFYGSGRSHTDIANWLGVPVTTVSRRLAHARRRMRARALDAFAGGLRTGRATVGDAFVVEFSARLRRSGPEDAAALAQLASMLGLEGSSAAVPSACPAAYLVEDPTTGAPIAYAASAPSVFRPIHELHLAIGEDALRRHAADVLLTQILQDLEAIDAIALRHRTSEPAGALGTFLLTRGFEVVHASAGTLTLERLLRKTVPVSPCVLDECAGTYVPVADARARFPQAASMRIVIERQGDFLVSQSGDMRDVLLSASDGWFFTRHHHGRGRFERDAAGRVVRVVYTDGPHQLVLDRV